MANPQRRSYRMTKGLLALMVVLTILTRVVQVVRGREIRGYDDDLHKSRDRGLSSNHLRKMIPKISNSKVDTTISRHTEEESINGPTSSDIAGEPRFREDSSSSSSSSVSKKEDIESSTTSKGEGKSEKGKRPSETESKEKENIDGVIETFKQKESDVEENIAAINKITQEVIQLDKKKNRSEEDGEKLEALKMKQSVELENIKLEMTKVKKLEMETVNEAEGALEDEIGALKKMYTKMGWNTRKIAEDVLEKDYEIQKEAIDDRDYTEYEISSYGKNHTIAFVVSVVILLALAIAFDGTLTYMSHLLEKRNPGSRILMAVIQDLAAFGFTSILFFVLINFGYMLQLGEMIMPSEGGGENFVSIVEMIDFSLFGMIVLYTLVLFSYMMTKVSKTLLRWHEYERFCRRKQNDATNDANFYLESNLDVASRVLARCEREDEFRKFVVCRTSVFQGMTAKRQDRVLQIGASNKMTPLDSHSDVTFDFAAYMARGLNLLFGGSKTHHGFVTIRTGTLLKLMMALVVLAPIVYIHDANVKLGIFGSIPWLCLLIAALFYVRCAREHEIIVERELFLTRERPSVAAETGVVKKVSARTSGREQDEDEDLFGQHKTGAFLESSEIARKRGRSLSIVTGGVTCSECGDVHEPTKHACRLYDHVSWRFRVDELAFGWDRSVIFGGCRFGDSRTAAIDWLRLLFLVVCLCISSAFCVVIAWAYDNTHSDDEFDDADIDIGFAILVLLLMIIGSVCFFSVAERTIEHMGYALRVPNDKIREEQVRCVVEEANENTRNCVVETTIISSFRPEMGAVMKSTANMRLSSECEQAIHDVFERESKCMSREGSDRALLTEEGYMKAIRLLRSMFHGMNTERVCKSLFSLSAACGESKGRDSGCASETSKSRQHFLTMEAFRAIVKHIMMPLGFHIKIILLLLRNEGKRDVRFEDLDTYDSEFEKALTKDGKYKEKYYLYVFHDVKKTNLVMSDIVFHEFHMQVVNVGLRLVYLRHLASDDDHREYAIAVEEMTLKKFDHYCGLSSFAPIRVLPHNLRDGDATETIAAAKTKRAPVATKEETTEGGPSS